MVTYSSNSYANSRFITSAVVMFMSDRVLPSEIDVSPALQVLAIADELDPRDAAPGNDSRRPALCPDPHFLRRR